MRITWTEATIPKIHFVRFNWTILPGLALNQIFPINVSSSMVDPDQLKIASGSLARREAHTSDVIGQIGLRWREQKTQGKW